MERTDIIKAAMDYCEAYMPYEPGARLDPNMEQAYKDGFVAGAIWANNANAEKTPNHIGMGKERKGKERIERVLSNKSYWHLSYLTKRENKTSLGFMLLSCDTGYFNFVGFYL